MTESKRLSTRPLPPYRHIPGTTPHPSRDPGGYDHGRPEPEPPSLETVAWYLCEEYLFGVDLFNHHYWWACHEVMEGLWHAAGRRTPAGECLQAVIQCAVAHLKTETGNHRGARLLLQNAERHAALAGRTELGLDLVALLAATHAYVHGRSPTPAVLSPTPPPDGSP